MSDTVYKLQKRVEQYSTEAQVYQEGSDRITVEIPGVTDADAILKNLANQVLCVLSHSRMMTETQTFTDQQRDRICLARSLDEIRESGSVVLEGTDVADAQGGAFQQQNTAAESM